MPLGILEAKGVEHVPGKQSTHDSTLTSTCLWACPSPRRPPRCILVTVVGAVDRCPHSGQKPELTIRRHNSLL